MLNFEKCQYLYGLSLDKDNNFDYSLNGKYGYGVFYMVPLSELATIWGTLDETVISGRLEFSVDASGNQFGEVYLWKVMKSDGSVTNESFNYFENITEFVNDFNTRVNLIRRDILFSQMENIMNLLRCHDDFSVESAQENYEIIKAIRGILGIDERL